MQTALRLSTPVLPGKRIELSAPDLREGDTVEVIILLPGVPNQAAPAPPPSATTISEFLGSLPARDRPLLYGTWAEYEERLRSERGAWDG
ncbi:MAG: hypothetical protein NT029_01060 [Armatimonadetes bacterium]|nr:hypothetical protein [Armatimonadota bacterium]